MLKYLDTLIGKDNSNDKNIDNISQIVNKKLLCNHTFARHATDSFLGLYLFDRAHNNILKMTQLTA